MNSKGKRKKRPWRSLKQLETCLEGLGKTMKTLRITSVKTKMRKGHFLNTLQTEPICSVSGKVHTRVNADTQENQFPFHT